MSKVAKAKDVLVVGQPIINAKDGSRNGSVGVIKAVDEKSFRVEWLLSPEGVPFDSGKSSRFSLLAMAPKYMDILDPVPCTRRGFAFIYPLTGMEDVEKMVEAHRIDAENQSMAIQTGFWMIGGVHKDTHYNINDRSCPTQPPVKKYLDKEEALSDAAEMAHEYNQAYVVLEVAAIVRPKSTPEIKHEVEILGRDGQPLLESKDV